MSKLKSIPLLLSRFLNQTYTINHLEGLIDDIRKKNVIRKHRGVIGIRKLISNYIAGGLQRIINSGVIPLLVSLAKRKQYPHLQL
jgi:hypothetical protein